MRGISLATPVRPERLARPEGPGDDGRSFTAADTPPRAHHRPPRALPARFPAPVAEVAGHAERTDAQRREGRGFRDGLKKWLRGRRQGSGERTEIRVETERPLVGRRAIVEEVDRPVERPDERA